jgi:hypothetical protein
MKTIELNGKFRNILLLATAIIVILLLWSFTKDWIKPRIVKSLGGYTESEVKMTRDTLEVRYNDIYIKYKEILTKVVDIPEPEIIIDYRYIPVNTPLNPSTKGKSDTENVQFATVKRYQTAVNDTILDGIITSIITVDSCKLVEQSFKYTPKIPYIREKIVTIVETKETILSDKPKAYIGAGLQVNTLNQVTPNIKYLTKSKWLIEGGYSKSLENTYPDAVIIGVAKFF